MIDAMDIAQGLTGNGALVALNGVHDAAIPPTSIPASTPACAAKPAMGRRGRALKPGLY
jgi:hypothetical protein